MRLAFPSNLSLFALLFRISPPDGDGEVSIIITDALGVKMADGITDVSGDHHKDNVPPSENDYCIGLLIRFGDFTYVTAGDLDGEYATSGFGYTYNGWLPSLWLNCGN